VSVDNAGCAPTEAGQGSFSGSGVPNADQPDSPIHQKTGRPQVPVMPPPWLHAS